MKRVISAILLVTLLTSILCSAFKIMPVGAVGTIYIRADGSIDPPMSPIYTTDNTTYTLTGNITADVNGIVIERNNIVVDGIGFTLQGAGAGVGFTLNANNVTIRRTVIAGFDAAGSSFAAAIYSFSTINNIIVNDTITGNKWGVDLEWVSGYIIVGNSIVSQNESGIYMRESRNNIIYENDINKNKNGITLADSSNNNKLYHNNFVDNVSPGFAVGSDNNVWDDGYPSGGNFWGADYLVNYPGASEIDSSGIWDTPYVVDGNNTDRYPLINPVSTIPEFLSFLIIPLFMIATLLVVIVHRKRGIKNRKTNSDGAT
jgi:parallel beta-helix repeat protein